MSTFIHDIDAFCGRHKIAPTRLGKEALNDKAFVSQIKAGRRVWPETEQRVREFMAKFEQPSDIAA